VTPFLILLEISNIWLMIFTHLHQMTGAPSLPRLLPFSRTPRYITTGWFRGCGEN
jgi:hypothetical protein